jgi:NADH-quinone oxidoreductase subunit J
MFIVLFILSLIFDGIVLVSVRNPIQSILVLIILFLKASIIIIMLKIEFLALLLLLVYLGAVAVLFIFVVMMLNIKILERQEQIFQYIPLTILMAIWIFYLFDILIYLTFDWKRDAFFIEWISLIKNVDSISNLGYFFYSIWHIIVMISGLILFISMLGSIALALQPSEKKKLDLSTQAEIIDYTLRYFRKTFRR